MSKYLSDNSIQPNVIDAVHARHSLRMEVLQ
jgi:hypothetical protein